MIGLNICTAPEFLLWVLTGEIECDCEDCQGE